ncbi:hypothetical protein C5C17_11620 [Pseudoclavibacter sp. RFBA6]|nr:hypothetical protein C5C17_11620 [Pseudoclavibacter sp. RFBA6]
MPGDPARRPRASVKFGYEPDRLAVIGCPCPTSDEVTDRLSGGGETPSRGGGSTILNRTSPSTSSVATVGTEPTTPTVDDATNDGSSRDSPLNDAIVSS